MNERRAGDPAGIARVRPRGAAGPSLLTALLLLVLLVLVVGLVPAGVLLDRRLGAALEQAARDELANAPAVLADRWAATSGARMMHAKELAALTGLREALASGNRDEAVRLVEQAASYPGEVPVIVPPSGAPWVGPRPGATLLDQTRAGEMPVRAVADGSRLWAVALAPVADGQRWVGAAGVASPLDATEAGLLSGLTRAEVLLLGPEGRPVAGTPVAEALAGSRLWRSVVAERGAPPRASASADSVAVADQATFEIVLNGDGWLASIASLEPGVAAAVFLRERAAALAILPDLRRVAAASIVFALLLALLAGTFVAARLARPVRDLARAAESVAAGDFRTPVRASAIREVGRVRESFDAMRSALESRLRELEAANRELEDRQVRLQELQAELIQRDRVAATGRLLTCLAHEIRNPVANVRNCLELLRRRAADDAEAREFAETAIDELLRMHELAERMLDVHRPRPAAEAHCVALDVAAQVARLAEVGAPDDPPLAVRTRGDAAARAAIAPDALKQVLLNLVQNARDAMPNGGTVEVNVERAGADVVVEVQDDGPGISEAVLPRLFDPFFTTKSRVQGVGLGLYTAEGLVRAAGGRISAGNRGETSGARIRIELPSPASRSPERVTPAHTAARTPAVTA